LSTGDSRSTGIGDWSERPDSNALLRFSRRGLVKAAGAVAALGGIGALRGAARGAPTLQDTIPASPAASPAGSPGASPVALPSPTPTTPPQLLRIVEDLRPVYIGAPVDGGELRMLMPFGDNGNFNPAAARQDPQIPVSYLDPLVWIDEVTMEPLPWLATSWRWTSDSTSLTIELREGVRWHDGSALTAEDVAFSFLVYRDDYDSSVNKFFVTVDDVEVREDLRLVVRFNQPDGSFIFNACSQLIFQREQYADYWESQPIGQRTLNGYPWRDNPAVGTGPWRLSDRDDPGIVFQRNEEYWTTPPHFETFTLSVIEDRDERLAAWRSGAADLLGQVRFSDIPSLLPEPGTLYVSDSAAVMFAAFNFDNPNRANPALLADIELRRALSMAIDRERYAQEVFAGYIYEERAGTIAQPWANDPSAVNPARDVAGAQALLRAAGYRDTDGDGILESPDAEPLELELMVRNTVRDEMHAVLDSIVPDLAEIGVALTIRRLDAAQFEMRWFETRDFDLVAYAYPLYPGFADFDLYGSAWDIRFNIQGWNPGAYSNQEVDRLIREALVETEITRQAELLRKLQRVTNDDLFGLWFGFPRDLVLARPDIRGFQPNKQHPTRDTRKLWREPV
jgi:peptide/nickel transport system substrate-binding protein